MAGSSSCARYPATASRVVLRPISQWGDMRVRWSRSRGPAVTGLVEALVERPDDAVDDFLRFLDRSWLEWFSTEWARVRPILAARARHFAETVSARGRRARADDARPVGTSAANVDGATIAKVQNVVMTCLAVGCW